MDEQWRVLRVDPEQVRAADSQVESSQDDGPAGDYELAPDDWRAWTVFLACRHAWRVIVGLGGVYYDGIDPAAARSTVEMLGIKRKYWPDVLWRLQILESEARISLNKALEA